MCGWVYDPALGLWRRRIEPGTAFELLGGDFRCPACGASKAYFEPTA
jgi:rubredoxin